MKSKVASGLALSILVACSSGGAHRADAPSWTAAAGSGVAAERSVELAGQTSQTQAPALSTPAAAPVVALTAMAVAPSVAAAPTIAAGATPSAAPAGPPGLSVDSETGEVVFRTSPIELKGFEESYTCFAVTVDEDMVIDGFKKSGQLFVHHEQFVKTLLPEPDGVSVCNQQFKITWMPIFLAGNGPSELQFDEGVGHVIAAGSQLMLQMHLFNATGQAVKEAVEIRMHKSRSANATPVTPWAIGSSQINIPAKQAGRAQNVCMQNDPVEVLAVFPHMHQLGNKMTIEVGKSMDAMRPLYVRDPFSFDDQRMEKMKLKLEAGDILRVTCDFNTNPQDKAVSFGESSNDEMCFFVGFALGESPAQADCPNLWDALLTL